MMKITSRIPLLWQIQLLRTQDSLSHTTVTSLTVAAHGLKKITLVLINALQLIKTRYLWILLLLLPVSLYYYLSAFFSLSAKQVPRPFVHQSGNCIYRSEWKACTPPNSQQVSPALWSPGLRAPITHTFLLSCSLDWPKLLCAPQNPAWLLQQEHPHPDYLLSSQASLRLYHFLLSL